MIRLIAGLGNPGPDYLKTRHNAGVWFLERLAQKHQLICKLEKKFFGFHAQLTGKKTCHLLIPTTYMNQSGRAIGALMHYYQIQIPEILIVHDELDLPPGCIRFKYNGGHGGHNGIKNIITCLVQKTFWRLRIGIGHPGHHDLVHDYVLSHPNAVDREKILSAIENALAVLPLFIDDQPEAAMKQLHTQ